MQYFLSIIYIFFRPAAIVAQQYNPYNAPPPVIRAGVQGHGDGSVHNRHSNPTTVNVAPQRQTSRVHRKFTLCKFCCRCRCDFYIEHKFRILALSDLVTLKYYEMTLYNEKKC